MAHFGEHLTRTTSEDDNTDLTRAATLSEADLETLIPSTLSIKSPRSIPASDAGDGDATRPTRTGQLPVTVKPNPVVCEARRTTNCNRKINEPT